VAPGARTVTAALRVMGLRRARPFTNDHRVLNRATWSTRQAGRILWGRLITSLVPPGAPIGLGADDTVERRSGRQITATGCSRDAVRSTRKHVIHGCGLKWVVMRRLVPACVGVTMAHRAGPARRQDHAATAPDQCGLGPTAEAASPPLAARAVAGVGR
jgi:hypothetical protein